MRNGRAIIRKYIVRNDISKLLICVPAKICVSISVPAKIFFCFFADEPLDFDFLLFAALAGVACEKRESNDSKLHYYSK